MKHAQNKEKYYSPIYGAQGEEIIIQNSELNHKIGKSVTTMHKEQQFRQNNFNAPDDGRVGRNMSYKIGQMK
jgi:hypothetical protein